jgi:hypothetical protein
MLSMPFRDTVGQNPIDIPEVNSTHGHPRVMSNMRIKPVQEKWPDTPLRFCQVVEAETLSRQAGAGIVNLTRKTCTLVQ